MSTNINDIFNQATNDASKLLGKIDDDTLLLLYSFYKQATVGDNNTEKPSFFNFRAAKKWEAWNSVKGVSKVMAQGQYVKHVKDNLVKHNL
jgi:diazepam-binding inhibitor (GABA receptor modulating acyl-CoA-binding protein)